jgi:hypothetical protein
LRADIITILRGGKTQAGVGNIHRPGLIGDQLTTYQHIFLQAAVRAIQQLSVADEQARNFALLVDFLQLLA